ncbi:MAG: transporter [Pseudomonadales bacterium RIFCSPLOWO2_02_FULL_63_210]|uniref:mercury resistance system transport protein MerF n=1 Tax=Pseudomonas sp. TaxID=306 RepID=UPI0008B8F5CD|nr:MAG: transporter [Pseudomonadales bacterium RIFCSPLOWO2_02_FULL_63_210]
MSNPKTLLKIGVSGSVVAALCCFTPVLVILLGVVGLSAWVGYLDYVLFPALAAFVALTLYALHKKRKAEACCTVDSKTGEKQ